MREIVNGLLVQDHRILLLLRAPDRAQYPDTWSFPGGHVEPGESLDQALCRELAEEIGVTPTSWRFLSRFEDRATNPQNGARFHLFAVERWTGQPRLIGNEHTDLRWVELTQAPQWPKLTFPIYADFFAKLTM